MHSGMETTRALKSDKFFAISVKRYFEDIE